MADFELAVPGVIYIGSTAGKKDDRPAGGEASEGRPLRSAPSVVHLGAASGWTKPRGIRQWAREVSAIRRSALTEVLRKELGATLPHEQIAPALRAGQRVIVAAHGNSLRALVKYLDDIPPEKIVELDIPTGIPLVYELGDDLRPRRSGYLGDPEAAARATKAVADQGQRPK